MNLLRPDRFLGRTRRGSAIHQRAGLLHALIIEHKRASPFLEHALDAALLHRIVADPQPSPPCPRPCMVQPVLIANRALSDTLRAVATEGALRAWRDVAAVTGCGRPGLAAEADVVAEGVLAVVADDSGEAVECPGHCVGRRRWRDGTLDGDRGWGRGDGGRRLSGKLTGGCVWREIKDLGEDNAAVVLGGVAAVVHGAVEMKGEHGRGLVDVSTTDQGSKTRD